MKIIRSLYSPPSQGVYTAQSETNTDQVHVLHTHTKVLTPFFPGIAALINKIQVHVQIKNVSVDTTPYTMHVHYRKPPPLPKKHQSEPQKLIIGLSS